MKSETDIEPLRQLGWKPKYTIKEGLLKTVK
jgi:nucleoside-diphosphate-sugar epimerase